jgi:hypothetical protein
MWFEAKLCERQRAHLDIASIAVGALVFAAGF